jgi:2-desacetyl-2-hydroxyethyl bacteriochlorophyllide A dehydrogenase
VVAPGRSELRDEHLPEASESDVVVRTRFTAVSRGTESLVFSGLIPPAEYQRMRAPFQAGDFPGPVKYGYCNVGEVEQGPATLAGRTVFCLYPHQTRYVVPASAVQVLPDSVPAARGVLAANMETALNGVWDADIQPGDRVAVVGAGTVGCLVAWLASRIPGTEVCLVDINPARRAVAESLGVGFAAPAGAPAERDVVVHASGAPDGLRVALGLAAFEAVVVELSWFGAREVTLPLGEAFHVKRLTIRSSQVGHVATSRRARWDYRRRMTLALALLADPALDVLVTGESAFEDLPEVMPALAGGAGSVLCHRIRY